MMIALGFGYGTSLVILVFFFSLGNWAWDNFLLLFLIVRVVFLVFCFYG